MGIRSAPSALEVGFASVEGWGGFADPGVGDGVAGFSVVELASDVTAGGRAVVSTVVVVVVVVVAMVVVVVEGGCTMLDVVVVDSMGSGVVVVNTDSLGEI